MEKQLVFSFVRGEERHLDGLLQENEQSALLLLFAAEALDFMAAQGTQEQELASPAPELSNTGIAHDFAAVGAAMGGFGV